MAMAGFVHWHEGQYLQPHHLQMMQRQVMEQVANERKLSNPYSSGLIEIDFSADALSDHQVRFNRLKLVMPSGLLVEVPNNADLSPLLDIKQAFEASGGSLTVSIGVPVWAASRGNTIAPDNGQDHRAKRIYTVIETQQPDENNGENTQSVLMRRINARLLLDGDDQTDLEVLPLLRLTTTGGQDLGLPTVDPAFVPPCRVLGASATLMGMVRDIAHQVAASRKETMVQLSRGGFSPETIRGVQFQQMLRFKTLSRFSATLPQLAKTRQISPFEIYLSLMELLGELSALDPTKDRLNLVDYDHNRLGLVFGDLTDRVTSLLKKAGDEGGDYVPVSFQHDGKVPVATLTPQHFADAAEIYLAVQSQQDAHQVVELVENRDEFVLRVPSKIHKRVPGLELEHERTPPLQLPAQVGMHYFRIQTARSAERWAEVKAETKLAARWTSMETDDFQLKLYIMKASN